MTCKNESNVSNGVVACHINPTIAVTGSYKECLDGSVGNVNRLILDMLDKDEIVNSLQLSQQLHHDHQLIVGILKGFDAKIKEFIQLEQKSIKQIRLTDEGTSILVNGSHEYRIWKSVQSAGAEGIQKDKLLALFNEASIGFAKAMKNGWISFDRSSNVVQVKQTSNVEDQIQTICRTISKVDHQNGQTPLQEMAVDERKILDELKKRRIISEITVNYFVARKGSAFSKDFDNRGSIETDLTMDMVSSGTWKTCQFKPYNMDAKGIPPPCGCIHPLTKVRSYFRQIFLEMGFEEMPTNQYIENSFWNFDALFQPQQHPARDIQDTFFMAHPATSDDFPKDYMERVSRVHSIGDYGSTGYQYEWSVEEARKTILRTHTTAVSARMLYKLAQKESGFEPVKYFSIDKVFRNENMDATHLAEFHQVEGLIADYDLNIGDLIGILSRFYARIGIRNLKFKPAYNPYTEPSMEIFCYHEGLKKLIEVGNSGIFRPEMLLPMGLPSNVKVLAWGLSLERPAMILSKVHNIRDLVGHKVDINMCKSTPFCNYGY